MADKADFKRDARRLREELMASMATGIVPEGLADQIVLAKAREEELLAAALPEYRAQVIDREDPFGFHLLSSYQI